MFGLIASGVTIALVTGAVWKFVLDRLDGPMRITRPELLIGTLVVTLLICPLTAWAGTKVAISANSKFNEYWNGWEESADVQIKQCTRDGSCRHEYQCDPYVVMETYYTTDAKGNMTAHTRPVTQYHQCPVGSHEAAYIVRTSVGDVTLSSGQFTPETTPWRAGRGLGSVPTAPPALWTQAKDRIDAGDPGPATSVHTYDNWILASQQTVLARYSTAIERYQGDGLLPKNTTGVREHYLADKAHFVGQAPTGAERSVWQDAVARTASALGTAKQGDLHVVLVRSAKVTDPDEYTGALLASWQDPDLGRDALAKNAVVLVAGTSDGKTVAWARVATGMPVGNSGLQVAARTELNGVPWTPQALIGTPRAPGAASAAPAKGALEELLWHPTNGFTRVCMTCEEEGGVGYDYLKGELKPTAGQSIAIVAVMTVLTAAVWGGFAYGNEHIAPVRKRRR